MLSIKTNQSFGPFLPIQYLQKRTIPEPSLKQFYRTLRDKGVWSILPQL